MPAIARGPNPAAEYEKKPVRSTKARQIMLGPAQKLSKVAHGTIAKK